MLVIRIAPSLALPRREAVSQCHSGESFGRAQDKFRDEESAFWLFGFGTQCRFDTRTGKKQILRYRAQDNAGAIFRIVTQYQTARGLYSIPTSCAITVDRGFS